LHVHERVSEVFFIHNLYTVWIKIISLPKFGLGKLKSFYIPCSVVMTTGCEVQNDIHLLSGYFKIQYFILASYHPFLTKKLLLMLPLLILSKGDLQAH